MTTHNNGENQHPRSNGRRDFVRSASITGAVGLTTVGAKPVWGACTPSGAISGGSGLDRHRVYDYCGDGGVTGKSPGTWKNLNDGQIRAMFGDNVDVDAKRTEIEEIQKANSFRVSYQMAGTANVYDAVNGGGWLSNLAAAWCNAYFGLFGSQNPPGITEMFATQADFAQAWVSHFDASLIALGGDPWNWSH